MAVLDTNFLIAVEQREEAALTWLAGHRHEEHHVPDVVAIEYLTGQSDPAVALDVIEAAFTLLHGTRSWVEATARFRKNLRDGRVSFRSPDFWIAAWAHFLDAPVLTRNKSHFKSLGVRVDSW